jgi:NAD(P)-dependent dehydrogenase (short-subunit alcohol dehydrogenase family)
MSESGQKVVIVTGGSQGIGAGLVDGYRQRGWAVVANSLHIKPSKDPDILTIAGDVSDQATADQIVSQAMDRFGRVDTLVNNAGVFVSKPFTDYTAEDYALVIGVNLTGFFWMTQRAIGHMLRQGSGHVVNLSASIAYRADTVEPTALAALTKGGLAAVTRSLAAEYATRGVRVNAVAPGIIQTPLLPPESYKPEALAGKLGPLGHVGQVSDVVDGILYLESAPFVTGEILHIDGGRLAGQ